jgi:antitoxin YefM
MSAMSASEARKNLFHLVDAVSDEGEPVLITGKRHNAVLVSESDWRAIQETLYLMRFPGMAASIREGMATPTDQMSEEPGW